jgi:hypothetical protein
MIPGGIPTNHTKLISAVADWVAQCRVSVAERKAYYRLLHAIAETGKYDGTKALINKMYPSLTRTAAHLFSPVELKFSVTFDKPQPQKSYERATEVAKQLTLSWERNGTSNRFGRGVFEALKYGACFLKQWVELDAEEHPVYQDKLVMPWNMGVYREDRELHEQPIICETAVLTMPEVWQRIWKFPNAEKILDRIRQHSSPGNYVGSEPSSFFHQVLSTSQLNTGMQGMISPVPGGIVQLNSDPNYALMGPTIGVDTVQLHELWVQDEDDYVTIQFIEPDILITPWHGRLGKDEVVTKKENLLARGSRLQPYRIIQPNETSDWLWGRSELVDIIEPQQMLAQWCEDAKRLMSVQIDKIIGFVGDNSITDESYAAGRLAGYFNLGQGSDMKDLTPKFPQELLPMLKFLMEEINLLLGFPPIMQGQGEQGVRAGSHASTLMKTGSPTLRDRSLLVEQQAASAADLTLTLKELKDARYYWTKADQPVKDIEETKFLLSDLSDDWRVVVDSHSSSPIFQDENTNLVSAAQQRGIVDGEFFIRNTPMPNQEMAIQAFRKHQAQQAQMFQQLLKQDPEAAHKMMAKQFSGGHGGHH